MNHLFRGIAQGRSPDDFPPHGEQSRPKPQARVSPGYLQPRAARVGSGLTWHLSEAQAGNKMKQSIPEIDVAYKHHPV